MAVTTSYVVEVAELVSKKPTSCRRTDLRYSFCMRAACLCAVLDQHTPSAFTHAHNQQHKRNHPCTSSLIKEGCKLGAIKIFRVSCPIELLTMNLNLSLVVLALKSGSAHNLYRLGHLGVKGVYFEWWKWASNMRACYWACFL